MSVYVIKLYRDCQDLPEVVAIVGTREKAIEKMKEVWQNEVIRVLPDLVESPGYLSFSSHYDCVSGVLWEVA